MSGMMKSVEKIHRPSASNSLNSKQMRRSRFGPGPQLAPETEHEAPTGVASLFSYNLTNLPASPALPAVQRKEPEDEEIQMKPSCPGCAEEEEAIQAKFVGEGIAPTVQRQADPDTKEEEVLQGKFMPVQRTGEDEEEDPLQGRFESNASNAGSTRSRPKPNRTGMPDGLKAGIEALSGLDMSDVRVHYSSPKPAQLHALAYTQGSDIHVAPGQERHLAHEAWHVVQQAQGRVGPTMQLQGVEVNYDTGLEREADFMGSLALQRQSDRTPHVVEMMPDNSVVQCRVGLEIEISVPVDRLTPPDIAALSNYVVYNLAPTPAQIQHGQTLADVGQVATLTHVLPQPAGAGFHVDTDHDDRVKSPQGTWPPREAADGILEIVMDPPVATTAELDNTMNNIQAFIANINIQTNNLRHHWTTGGGVNVGPLYFPRACGPAGIPAQKQPNHNFKGSIQANVGIDLREYHSLLKWYAKSRYAPRPEGTDPPAIANQRADMIRAVNIGRSAIAHIQTVGFPPATAPLTMLQVQQMGNLRGLRGWLTHAALALIRGAYIWGINGTSKNVVPVLLKSPNNLVLQHGLTIAEMAYYTANKADIVNHMLAATHRLALDPLYANRVFKTGGIGVGPTWTITQLFDETLNDAALIAAANIKNPSDVGPARTGNAQVTAITNAPVLPNLGGGLGRRAGMVSEFRTIRGLYDGVAAWKGVAKAFLQAADKRNTRSGLEP